MNKAIVMTCFRRPDYLKQVLDSLSKNSGLEDYTLYLCCEPGFPEVLKVCQEVSFMKRVIRVNPKVLGVRDNPFTAIRFAFSMGADAILTMEDDVIVAQDFVKLFDWYLELPNREEFLCLNAYNHESNLDSPDCIVRKRDFNSLCFGFTKSQWIDRIEKVWHKEWEGWDFGPTRLLNSTPDLYTLQPTLSRTSHIGREGGTHYLKHQHDHIYHNKPINSFHFIEEFYHMEKECYASCLGECSGKITKEHYVSKGILSILNVNDGMRVAGLPFISKNDMKKIHPSALSSKILCEKHNNYLSKYDSACISFFEKIMNIFDNIQKESQIINIDYKDLERIAIKIILGFNKTYPKQFPINDEMIKFLNKILFDENTNMVNKGGLCFYGFDLASRKFEVIPFFNKNNELSAIHISFNGIIFSFCYSGLFPPKQNTEFNNPAFPNSIILNKDKFNHKIIVDWNGRESSSEISVDVFKEPQ